MATLKDLLQGKSGDGPQVDPQALAEVQEAVNTLTKTLKVFRTYPRENSISISAVDELTRCLQQYLGKHETLELFVDRHELQWHGAPVYSESDQRKSVALKLDRDGVRRMVFSNGIDRKEVVSMLEVLSAETDQESLSDDVVTLLWEKQLQHMRVYVLDDLSQGQDEAFDQTLVDASAPAEPADAEKPSGPQVEGISVASGRQQLTLSATRLSTVCTSTKVKLQPVTERHQETLRKMTETETSKNVTEDLTDILFEIVRSGAEEQVFSNAVRVLVELSIMNAKSATFGKAAEILATLRAFAAGEGEISKELRARIVEQLQSLADPTRVQAIVASVQEQESLNGEDLAQFLMTLPAESAPELCPLLSVPRTEKPTRRALLHLIKDNPALLAPRVASDDVETAKKILEVLEEAPTADFADKLEGPLAAAPPEVKVASVKLLTRMKSDGARRVLLAYVLDDGAGLRRVALKALSAFSGGREQATVLRELVTAKGFEGRSLDEKRSILSVLARLESQQAIPFLVHLAGRRKWFESKGHAETRACAALALGEINDPQSGRTLERLASDKSHAVRTAVKVALDRQGRPSAAAAR